MNNTAQDTDALLVGFDDMHLKVGDPLRMQAVGTADASHHPIKFIGAVKDASFLTTLPLNEDGRGMWMKPNGQFVFRALSGMYVYAFTCHVLRAHSKPYPYAHFAYPERIQAKQVRRSHRINVNLPVKARGPDGQERDAVLYDISLDGALLETRVSIGLQGEHAKLQLPIALAEVDTRLDIEASIRNVQIQQGTRADLNLFRYGIEFGDLSGHDALLLHYFIDHLIAQRVK